MLCECGKVAFYRVGKEGFCKEHYAEATNANKKRNDLLRSWASVRQYVAATSNPKDMSRGGATRRSEYQLELNGKAESAKDQSMRFHMGHMESSIPYSAVKGRRKFTK